MSFAGDSLGLVALMLHVADTTGRALAVAWLLLAGDFAPALLGFGLFSQLRLCCSAPWPGRWPTGWTAGG